MSTRTRPTARRIPPIDLRMGSLAPMRTSMSTPMEPSAFIPTIQKLPSVGSHVRVWVPDPEVWALQNEWTTGAPPGAPPLLSL